MFFFYYNIYLKTPYNTSKRISCSLRLTPRNPLASYLFTHWFICQKTDEEILSKYMWQSQFQFVCLNISSLRLLFISTSHYCRIVFLFWFQYLYPIEDLWILISDNGYMNYYESKSSYVGDVWSRFWSRSSWVTRYLITIEL